MNIEIPVVNALFTGMNLFSTLIDLVSRNFSFVTNLT